MPAGIVIKILVVEDESLILSSLMSTLRHSGSEVTAVTNGKDALAKICSSSYHLCFLDINLPDANGLDLMRTMKEVSPGTRIVIMTANEMSIEQLSYIKDNAWLFLPKPFDLEDIRSIVRHSAENQSQAL